jgi:choloylglycine hydrolase
LSPVNPNPVKVDGITFISTGQGSGMLGLPGDISPPSRFVKTAVLLQTALPANDATSAVNLAQHIINNVDIPLGLVREPQQSDHYTNEYTQWVVFKDLTNKIFYYRTYEDLNLHAVSLAKVDLSENATPLKMPIAAKPQVQDMTEPFLSSKVTP